MSPTYDYLHTNTIVNKNGELHLGMLPFITPFELVFEKIDGKEVTSLVYQDVNVNHNTLTSYWAYEICNNTNDFAEDNVIDYSSGHEVDISKEFQLVFWNNDKVIFLSMNSDNTTTRLTSFSFVLCYSITCLKFVQ